MEIQVEMLEQILVEVVVQVQFLLLIKEEMVVLES